MAVPVQSFQTKYQSQITSRFGDTYRLLFQQDGYTGSVEDGPEVLGLGLYFGSRGKAFGQIVSSVRIGLYDPSLSFGNAITQASEREWRLLVSIVTGYGSGETVDQIWQGYVLPENIRQSINERGRTVEIDATDGLAYLSEYTYDGDAVDRKNLSNILYEAIKRVNPVLTQLPLNSQLRPYKTGTPITKEAFSTLFLDRLFLGQRTWDEILEELLLLTGTVAFFRHPGFDIVDRYSFGSGTYPLTQMLSDGSRGTAADTTITAITERDEATDTGDYEILAGASVEAMPSINAVDVEWQHGYDELDTATGDNRLENPEFEDSIGSDNWLATTSGISRIDDPDGDGGLLSAPVTKTGSQTPVVYAHQNVFVPAGEAYFGLRFEADARWYIAGETDPAAVTNTRVDWALRHTGDVSGDVTWWNHTSREWQETEIHNQFSPGGIFTPLAFVTSRVPERGVVQVRLYEGVDALITGQPDIESYQWSRASLQVVGASDGQVTATRTRVTNEALHASKIKKIPGSGAFVFGSDTKTNRRYRRAITINESGTTNANGFKRGDYTSGQVSTERTLAEYIARQELALGAVLERELSIRVKLFSAYPITPSKPLEHNSENYFVFRVFNDLLERKANVLAVIADPQTIDESDLISENFDADQAGASVSGGGGSGGGGGGGGGGGFSIQIDTEDAVVIGADDTLIIEESIPSGADTDTQAVVNLVWDAANVTIGVEHALAPDTFPSDGWDIHNETDEWIKSFYRDEYGHIAGISTAQPMLNIQVADEATLHQIGIGTGSGGDTVKFSEGTNIEITHAESAGTHTVTISADGGGTDVEANPGGTGLTALTTVTIDGTDYEVGSGTGAVYTAGAAIGISGTVIRVNIGTGDTIAVDNNNSLTAHVNTEGGIIGPGVRTSGGSGLRIRLPSDSGLETTSAGLALSADISRLNDVAATPPPLQGQGLFWNAIDDEYQPGDVDVYTFSIHDAATGTGTDVDSGDTVRIVGAGDATVTLAGQTFTVTANDTIYTAGVGVDIDSNNEISFNVTTGEIVRVRSGGELQINNGGILDINGTVEWADMFSIHDAATGTGTGVDAGDTLRFVEGGNVTITKVGNTFTFSATDTDTDTDTTYTAGVGLDLTGTEFTLDADLSDLNDVSDTAPATGQVLKWDGIAWAPADDTDTDTDTDTNFYVTGGSVAGTTLTLTREGLADVTITGLPSGGGGTDVVANPGGTGLTALTTVTIGGTDYEVGSGTASLELGDLTDVDLSGLGLRTGYLLQYEEVAGTWNFGNINALIDSSSGVSATYNDGGTYDIILDADLADLNDVSATAPTDGQAFLWSAADAEWQPGDIDSGTTYSEGNGINISGSTISVDVNSFSGLQFNSGQLEVGTFGPLYRSTNGINLRVGNGLDVDAANMAGDTLIHADTSSQSSVDTSGSTILDSITLDTYGHVTAIGTRTFDGYTFVAGDNMDSITQSGTTFTFNASDTDTDTNFYVTGGSVAGTTLTLTREGLTDVAITGLPSGGGGGDYSWTLDTDGDGDSREVTDGQVVEFNGGTGINATSNLRVGDGVLEVSLVFNFGVGLDYIVSTNQILVDVNEVTRAGDGISLTSYNQNRRVEIGHGATSTLAVGSQNTDTTMVVQDLTIDEFGHLTGTTLVEAAGDTTYTAGAGLNLTGTEFRLDADLADLNDVSATAPADGQAFLWSATDAEWQPGDIDTGTTYSEGDGINILSGVISLDISDTLLFIGSSLSIDRQRLIGTGLDVGGVDQRIFVDLTALDATDLVSGSTYINVSSSGVISYTGSQGTEYTFVAGDNMDSITQSGTTFTFNASDQDSGTTYTAGDGIDISSGSVISFFVGDADTVEILSGGSLDVYGDIQMLSGGQFIAPPGRLEISGGSTGQALRRTSGGAMEWYTPSTGGITAVNAGGGLAGGGTSGSIELRHDNTSSQLSVNTSGSTIIDSITLDTYGHVTAIGTRTFFGYTFVAGDNMDSITQSGTTFTFNASDQDSTYTWQLAANSGDPGNTIDDNETVIIGAAGGVTSTRVLNAIYIAHADTSSQSSVNTSGSTILDSITLDTYGHVTAIGTRTISIGSGDITSVTAGNYLTGGGTSGGVTLSHASGDNGTYGGNPAGSVRSITLDDGHVTGVVLNSGSDRRLKSNIEHFSNGLDIIRRLSPVTFDWYRWGRGMDRHAAGFIAQEIQEVMPYAVTTGPDGMHDYFDRYITAVNTAAIQELDNAMYVALHRISIAEQEIVTLKAEIAALQSSQS